MVGQGVSVVLVDEVNVMSTSQISVGQSYIDDDGDTVVVRKVHRSRGIVVLEGENGNYEMDLECLREALADGDFEEISGEDAGDLDDEDEG